MFSWFRDKINHEILSHHTNTSQSLISNLRYGCLLTDCDGKFFYEGENISYEVSILWC